MPGNRERHDECIPCRKIAIRKSWLRDYQFERQPLADLSRNTNEIPELIVIFTVSSNEIQR